MRGRPRHDRHGFRVSVLKSALKVREQKQIAALLDVKRTKVADWLRGKGCPTEEQQMHLRNLGRAGG